MDPEAMLGDAELSANVGLRRRSSSISDDYSVQKTNDDATECKFAAVKLNYYADEFLRHFMHITSEQVIRRDPEISMGYWARVYALQEIVVKFLQIVGSSSQIISLGAGFDTLYWRLKRDGRKFKKFVEVDFSSVTAKKIRNIRKPSASELVAAFSDKLVESSHTDLHAGDYHLIGADLRQSREFREKLESTGIDFNLPTLCLAECVLVYMSSEQSGRLISDLAFWLSTAMFVNYEQVAISDSFGDVMRKNLERRGLLLPGLSMCVDIETQSKRFLSSGWGFAQAWTMDEIYSRMLSEKEVQRIQKIELLDEKELLHQLLAHYCIAIAVKDDSGKYGSLKSITP
ncbi:hypothetical protein AB6A40_010342 [Gnathostoma spinigerum]|uniref:Leucine carboxyl methyltransferase 1 n=1 Tax=Gnathostoma spinigerum TaxID=75299 RepID=A0ABD6EUK4_9BILA